MTGMATSHREDGGADPCHRADRPPAKWIVAIAQKAERLQKGLPVLAPHGPLRRSVGLFDAYSGIN